MGVVINLPVLGKIGREFGFEGFDAGEAGGEFLGQDAGEFVFGDADGLVNVAQGVFGDDAVLGLAEDEAKGGRVAFVEFILPANSRALLAYRVPVGRCFSFWIGITL